MRRAFHVMVHVMSTSCRRGCTTGLRCELVAMKMVLAFTLVAAESYFSGEGEERAGRDATFQVDTPAGPHARYDVTRPDAHHRWLFRCAGLEVRAWEHWGETTAWVLGPTEAAKAEATRLEQPTLGTAHAVSRPCDMKPRPLEESEKVKRV